MGISTRPPEFTHCGSFLNLLLQPRTSRSCQSQIWDLALLLRLVGSTTVNQAQPRWHLRAAPEGSTQKQPPRAAPTPLPARATASSQPRSTGHRGRVCARPATHIPHLSPRLQMGADGCRWVPGQLPTSSPHGCQCRTLGQRLSHGAPVPRGWPGPGSPSSPAAALNQTGPAVSAGHVGLTHAANSLTPDTLCPRDAPTSPDPLSALRALWDGPGTPASLRVVQTTAGGAAGMDPAPLPVPGHSKIPDICPNPGRSAGPWPSTCPALLHCTVGGMLTPGHSLARGPVPEHQWQTQPSAAAAGQYQPLHPPELPQRGELPEPVLAARRPVRTRPASSRQTCWRHIQCFQLTSSSLPPTPSPTQPCSPGPTAVPPAQLPTAALGSGLGPPGTAAECSPPSLSSPQRWAELDQNQFVQAGLGSAAQCGVARHGTTPSWAVPLFPALPSSLQVPDPLLPPRPWPAVMGAHGEATSTPTNRSQWVLPAARASLPELPGPNHGTLPSVQLPSQRPAWDGLCWPAAAGFSHLLLAALPAQTHAQAVPGRWSWAQRLPVLNPSCPQSVPGCALHPPPAAGGGLCGARGVCRPGPRLRGALPVVIPSPAGATSLVGVTEQPGGGHSLEGTDPTGTE